MAGIPTWSMSITKVQLDLLQKSQSAIQLLGQPRMNTRGWWFLMKDGVHHAAAQSFLLWLQELPETAPQSFATTGMTQADRDDVVATAGQAIHSLEQQQDNRASSMDVEAADFDHQSGLSGIVIGSVLDPRVEWLAGNRKVAFLIMATEGKSEWLGHSSSGLLHSFLVLRKQQNGWKVLMLQPSSYLSSEMESAERLAHLIAPNTSRTQPASPMLVAPDDGARQTRFPKQEIAWDQSGPDVATYIVESQFGNPRVGLPYWSPTRLDLVLPDSSQHTIRIPSPFGVGMQPHRWRVWAVGKDGTIALSEWRLIQFTN
jgi:hypothetical protein